MNRTKEEFDDAARPPLRKFIADPIICLNAAQWAAAVIVKPGHDLATSAVRPVDTFQSAWRAPKKKCGFVGPASPSIWITGAHCAAPAKFWITDYNICELLDFHNRGPFDRIFGQTKAKKHKIKKTIDFQKPLPQNLRKRWNV